MDLQRLGRPLRVAGRPRAVEDDQQVVVVGVELRPLAELERVLERHRMQAERRAEALDLLVGGGDEVDPEELVALTELRDLRFVDRREDVHGARPSQPRARERPRPPRAAGALGSIRNHAASAARAVAIAAIVSPVPSASTKACSLAARTLPGAPLTAAPEPSASTSRSRAGSGTFGSDCARSWRPTVATSAPSAATPNVPPTIRVIDSVPEATPAFVRSTAFIAAVLIGDIVKPMPSPSRTNGTKRKAKLVSTWIRDCQASEIVTSDEADHERCARADAIGEPAGQRPGDHDHQRRGQEAHAGLQRRVAEDVLHVEREEEEDREHPERDREGDDVRAHERARPEEAEVDDRRARAALDHAERDQADRGERRTAR